MTSAALNDTGKNRQEHESILKENVRRLVSLLAQYDPLTGRDAPSLNPRVKLVIPDAPIPEQWVPPEMMKSGLVKEIVNHGSIQAFIENHQWKSVAPTHRMIELELLKLRNKYDFIFWAFYCIKIKHKRGGRKRFKINYAQAQVLLLCEKLRLADEPIDIIICKARQWGGSTFSIFYQTWLAFKHNPSHSFVVAAQTKPVAQGIVRMLSRALKDYPAWDLGLPEGEKLELAQVDGTCYTIRDSHKHIIQDHEIYIGTIKEPDGIRGFAVSGAHLSEVGIWDDTPARRAEDLMSDVCGGILPLPLTMQVMESTAKGEGYFKQQWDAAVAKETAFNPIFIPWYYIEHDTLPIKDYDEFIAWLLRIRYDSEPSEGWKMPGRYYWWLWEQGATLEGINWYRYKERTFTDRASMEHEAPSDAIEAFRSSGTTVFDKYDVARLAKNVKPWRFEGELHSEGAKGEDVLRGVHFFEKRGGDLKIWEKPDRESRIAHRYLVVVDIGGRSKEADWSVIRVFDRFLTMPLFGGGPIELVAQMRYHTDHDLLAWDAARIAHWYNDALLVIESNTLETKDQERDVDGNMADYILDLVADVYPNLYARSGKAENIDQKEPTKWGFHTNVDTKPKIIGNMQECLRENLWIEHDRICCAEIGMYQKNAKGQFSAPPGRGMHDDVLMATAIALWISFREMDEPYWEEDMGDMPQRERVSSNSMVTM